MGDILDNTFLEINSCFWERKEKKGQPLEKADL